MVRAIWKGAISFGLVHIPVSLSTAVHAEGVDFDWLDKRSMDPVGYKRVNKVTGKEIDKSQIVKGVEYEKGRYVVISEEEIRKARPEATQTIDIFPSSRLARFPCSISIPRTTSARIAVAARFMHSCEKPCRAPARSPWPRWFYTLGSIWHCCVRWTRRWC